MTPVSDFSGLINCACALASAAANAATDSLERCMGRLQVKEIKAHCARLRAPCPQPMADCLLGILRKQGLELAFRPLVLEVSRPGPAKQRRELRPAVGGAHIHNANGFDARAWWFGIDEVGCFPGLDTAPELLFRRDQDAKIEWVYGDRDFRPFAATGDDREHR